MTASSDSIRTVLIDDHPLLRQGVALALGQAEDLDLVGEAADVETGIQLIRETKPSVAVVDLTLEDRSGMEIIKFVASEQPGTAVLVLSMHDEDMYAERCLRAGARGYLMKNRGPDRLANAIRTVHSGRLYVSDAVAQRLLNEAVSPMPSDRGELSCLTDREFEVFELFGTGKTSKQVGDTLGISHKTIDVHRIRIRKKLNLQTNADLMHYAVRWVQSHEPSV
ncbi:MAG: response regulator transcription factor [Verrucomicrobiales bacterium]|nr:response regulator transcription factor [Verrucomicrobiales bacterium]